MLNGILNNTLVQIVVYNMIGQLVGAVLGPYAQAISNQVWNATPIAPLSPAIMADLVERGEITEAEGAAEARLSGIDGNRFHLMTRGVGQPPAPGQLADALRRGIIDRPTYERGIRQGVIRVEWADTLRRLSEVVPPPGLLPQAEAEGQLPPAEARKQYAELGGSPEWYDLLVAMSGQSPTPLQAVEMANRGVIPWDGRGREVVSYEQAFLEGPWRNKWMDPFRKLAEYIPPPRTVTAMYREGSINRARAAELLHQNGLPEDLIGPYLQQGSQEKTAADRKLAQSTVVTLYTDQLIPRTDAASMLIDLGYEDDEAEFVLAIADMQLAKRYTDLAVGRVRTYYVARKIDRPAAINALARFGVTGDRASTLMGLWDWERASNARELTASEIYTAWKYSLLTEQEATARLVDLGYTPRDAWLYLSVKNKGPLDTAQPADDTTPPPGP